jgi:hypothetical protein
MAFFFSSPIPSPSVRPESIQSLVVPYILQKNCSFSYESTPQKLEKYGAELRHQPYCPLNPKYPSYFQERPVLVHVVRAGFPYSDRFHLLTFDLLSFQMMTMTMNALIFHPPLGLVTGAKFSLTGHISNTLLVSPVTMTVIFKGLEHLLDCQRLQLEHQGCRNRILSRVLYVNTHLQVLPYFQDRLNNDLVLISYRITIRH